MSGTESQPRASKNYQPDPESEAERDWTAASDLKVSIMERLSGGATAVFTPLDLLVVTLILGTLAAVILPAVFG